MTTEDDLRIAVEAAMKADGGARFQSFNHAGRYWIRDLTLPYGQQEVWSLESHVESVALSAMDRELRRLRTEQMVRAAFEAIPPPGTGRVGEGL